MRTVPVYIPDPDYIDRQLDTELAAHAQAERRPRQPAPNADSARPGTLHTP
jgi:hypothetical protein